MKPNQENDLQKPHYQIRPILHYDFRDILRIERASFPNAWSFRELDKVLAQPFVYGYLIDRRDYLTALETEVVGFMIMTCIKSSLTIKTIAVDPEFRREGVASKILRTLLKETKKKGKMLRARCLVRERNLAMQMLLKKHGFKCVNILPKPFTDDREEDGYQFSLRLKEETPNGKDSHHASSESH